MEFAANTKRKALAVLHWAMESDKQGLLTIDSAFHARTESILASRSQTYDGQDKLD